MYKKFDKIVADHEASEAAANTTPEITPQQLKFLNSLPSNMRNDPNLIKSIQTSSSFEQLQQVQKTNITRDDVEAWARGDDETDVVESAYSTLTAAVEAAVDFKTAGNTHFKTNQLELAVQEYTAGLKSIEIYNRSGNQQINAVKIAMLSNRAACYLSLEQFEAAVLDCTIILRQDSKHVKALWRRSQALSAINDVTSAASDLRALLLIEPRNKKAKIAFKNIIKQEQSKHENPIDNESLLLKKEGKTLLKSIQKRDITSIHSLLPIYVNRIRDVLQHEQWQARMGAFYTSGIDDALLSLCKEEETTEETTETTETETTKNIESTMMNTILLSIKELYNLGFARLMQYTDETDEEDEVPHFFGSTMMSSRASVRALLRTSMTGNKTQLEKFKQFMNKTNSFIRPQMWICNADRELMNRIRTNDLNGALFHAFEGEVYRHVARGTLHSSFFCDGEKRGGMEQILAKNVQQRLRQFVYLSTK